MRTMRKLPILALGAALLTAGCYDPYGNLDPGRTALLGAGIGAAAGLGIAAASQPPRRHYYGYNEPRPVYHARPRGYYAPRAGYAHAGPPQPIYGRPRPYYDRW
jgi:hypothetical protein